MTALKVPATVTAAVGGPEAFAELVVALIEPGVDLAAAEGLVREAAGPAADNVLRWADRVVEALVDPDQPIELVDAAGDVVAGLSREAD